MRDPYQVADETFVIPDAVPVPGIGLLPVNAMVVRGEQPMLVDTLATVHRESYLERVFEIVEPEDVKWLFISHEDRDHTGSVMQVMERCPNARLITNFLGLGKLAEEFEVPLERVNLLNDGESLDIGDRVIEAIRPPLYDSSATRGFYDPKTDVYFSADCFGTVLTDNVPFADDMSAADMEEGFYWMNRANHIWFHHIPTALIEEQAARIRAVDPALIVTGHGPTFRHDPLQVCDWIARIGDMEPVPMPNQAEFEKSLAGA
ncbi:MBL fold metallo-hydrolase [Nocardioides sp. cx-169]|uniref:MBL fold metallo-hydrolase n=1 Tax=Nocardioides sp. cx-169 TaxID=2899080 RepID=UPI001E318FB8|nr:MBL fold metallo-hydrolase [Nocardioides sp. cx-169]MCD4534274.1 MBL fold metallo-hydrolase [Nocardioides sp. cx-169]